LFFTAQLHQAKFVVIRYVMVCLLGNLSIVVLRLSICRSIVVGRCRGLFGDDLSRVRGGFVGVVLAGGCRGPNGQYEHCRKQKAETTRLPESIACDPR